MQGAAGGLGGDVDPGSSSMTRATRNRSSRGEVRGGDGTRQTRRTLRILSIDDDRPPSDSGSDGDASPAAAAPSRRRWPRRGTRWTRWARRSDPSRTAGRSTLPRVARRVAKLWAEGRALRAGGRRGGGDTRGDRGVDPGRAGGEGDAEEARRSLAGRRYTRCPAIPQVQVPGSTDGEALAKALAQEDLLALALEPA